MTCTGITVIFNSRAMSGGMSEVLSVTMLTMVHPETGLYGDSPDSFENGEPRFL
jgi:hypothetical protein